MKPTMLFSLGALSMILLSGCTIPDPTPMDPLAGYETIIVEKRQIDHPLTWVGTIEPIETVLVSTEIPGKLLSIDHPIGSTVPAGMTLARIDTEEAGIQAQTASSIQASLGSAQQATTAMFDAQIDAMHHQLAIAREQASIAKESARGEGTHTDDALRLLDQQIRTAQQALTNLDGVYATKKHSILAGAEDAINRGLILTTDTLALTDSLLGVSRLREKDNDAFESSLSARNTSFKDEAVTMRSSLDARQKQIAQTFAGRSSETTTDTLDDQSNKATLITLVDEMTIYMQDLERFLKKMQDVLDVSVSNDALSEAQIQGYKQQISTIQQHIESLLLSTDAENLLGLKGTAQMLAGLDANYQLDITNQREQIRMLESQRTATANGQSTKTTIAEQQVRIAEQSISALERQLDALQAQKATQIALLASQTIEAGGNVAYSKVIVNNGNIAVPFESIILESYLDKGSIVGPGVPIMKVGNNTAKQLTIYLPEQYRSLIEPAKTIPVRIDDMLYTSTIYEIAPSADNTTRTIKITLLLPDDDSIVLGSLGHVVLDQDDQGTNIPLVIPRTYIRYKYGLPYVWKIDQNTNQPAQTSIQLGICDSIYCQIKTGLREGERIIKL